VDYVGPVPDVYYGMEAMSHSERADFLVWFEDQKGKIFNNGSVGVVLPRRRRLLAVIVPDLPSQLSRFRQN
jgi:hypothetical protein